MVEQVISINFNKKIIIKILIKIIISRDISLSVGGVLLLSSIKWPEWVQMYCNFSKK